MFAIFLLRQFFLRQPQDLVDWQSTVSLSLDKLGLFTTEVYQKSRESVIVRQH